MGDMNGLGPGDNRGHSKQINLALQDSERNKSMVGRSREKLKNEIGQFERQQINNLYSIKRDQQLLRQELSDVRQSSGHSKIMRQSMKKQEAKQIRKEPCRLNAPNASKIPNHQSHKLHREPSKLPHLTKQSRQMKKAHTYPIQITQDLIEETRERPSSIDCNDHAVLLRSPPKGKETLAEIKRKISRDSMQLPAAQSLSQSEQELQGPWNSKINDVRTNINKRLSTSMNELSTENKPSNSNEPDLTQFMYAHPDGTPRMRYLMPSFDDRFQQAMKARYIRRPGTKLDPIDKELDLDEIFDRKK